MVSLATPELRTIDELNAWLTNAHIRGQWVGRGDRGARLSPPFGAPFRWDGALVREALEAARTLVPLGVPDIRRTVVFVHPSLSSSITPTISMAVQLVTPGETALAHRHTPTAVRFIIEGDGSAYTIVDGEKCAMERGDLVLTPNWSWHEHRNDGDHRVVWVDGLDLPLVQSLSGIVQVPYPSDAGQQPLCSPVDNALRRPGDLAPPGTVDEQRLVFKWRQAWEALHGMHASETSAFDGRVIQYRNPRYNGNTLATFNCWLQLLEPGETLRFHRHTYNHVYYAFEGRGVVELQDGELAWEQGDCFVIPNWTWHRHRNSETSQPSMLFSMNDLPILQYVDLVREEAVDGLGPPPDGE